MKVNNNKLIISILVLINITLLLIMRNNKFKSLELQNSIIQSIEDREVLNNNISESFWITLKAVDRYCNQTMLNTANGKSICIDSTLNKNSTKLYFRIFQNACSSCIQNEMLNLKELSKIIGKNNIIVIHNYDKKFSNDFFRKYNPDFNVYGLKNNDLLFAPMDTLSIPYYFTLDSTLSPKRIFPITSKFKNYSSTYLELISAILTDKE